MCIRDSLEIVLGVDNVIFISILSAKLPENQQKRARRIGLLGAMLTRIALLFSLAWIIKLTAPWFTILGQEISGRDLILIVGGLFLIGKSVYEIHDKLEGEEGHASAKVAASFASVITQILILDIVFSLDSVITAVGMVQTTPENRRVGLVIMITAVVIAVGVMLFAAKPIADFVNRHPTIKMLAFSFLILVGVVLVVDASHRHIPKGYIYFAMAFSIGVEMLNLRLRKKGSPVHLNQRAGNSPSPVSTSA